MNILNMYFKYIFYAPLSRFFLDTAVYGTLQIKIIISSSSNSSNSYVMFSVIIILIMSYSRLTYFSLAVILVLSNHVDE